MTEAEIRAEFPILSSEVKGHPLVYLDNGATTQKPRAVINALTKFYREENSNIHRGVHYLSMAATDLYDGARAEVGRFLGAADANEVVFVRGTTEAINMVATSFLKPLLSEGDEILVSEMEHHANIVPWQQLGVKVLPVAITDAGEIDVEVFASLLNERTKMVGLTHVSNVLGTVNPVADLIKLVREKAPNAKVLIDGAQAVAHGPVNVLELGCDFYVFSSHKLYGPDGVGVLWGRGELLRDMKPYQYGGDMVERVSFERTTYKRPPERFEAGTPNISGTVGLAAAIRFLQALGWEVIREREDAVRDAAMAVLDGMDGVTIHGRAAARASVVSFTLEGIHPHDIGTILDTDGIAIRAGNHCAQPLMKRLGVTGTARASMSFYNTVEEVEKLAASLRKVQRMFHDA
jgi:cysteine desulfurase/selenocysteine lyase